MFHTRAKCGWCEESGDFTFQFVGRYETPEDREREAPNPLDVSAILRDSQAHGGMSIRGYAVSLCPACRQPSLLLYRTRADYLESIRKNIPEFTPLFGNGRLVAGVETIPRPIAAQENPHWPKEITGYFKDAQLMLAEGKSPALIVSACRSVLDVSATALGAKGKTIATKIDSLYDQHILTKAMADWSHRLRLDGNEAIHEIKAEASQAAELVRFVTMFLDMCFTIPNTIPQPKP